MCARLRCREADFIVKALWVSRFDRHTLLLPFWHSTSVFPASSEPEYGFGEGVHPKGVTVPIMGHLWIHWLPRPFRGECQDSSVSSSP